jgi:tetratricopeptide (TPR) repeat protein
VPVGQHYSAEIRTNEGVAVGFRADIARIIKYAPPELIGREEELKSLSDAWQHVVDGEKNRPHVLTFVALGGEGKTSLVAKWAADLAFQDWPGCDAVFAWSFYSQGTREQTAVSSDAFLAEALTFFGDAAMAGSAQGAFDKGRRLAQLVAEQRALLILDGLEPLQYAPTSPTPGELKDHGISALLKGLAGTNHGLCVVTTRYSIADLRAYWQTTAPMHELPRLSNAAGVQLLRTIGVKTGSQAEFEKLVEDVDGHALSLQIIGQFLVRAFHGDIRRRDRINIEKADAKIQGGHAFRAMEAYVKWMEDESEEARREVALLKLLGLFDRPATTDCMDALRQAPAIPGLTEPLVGLAEDDWEFSLTSLRDAKLLTVNRDRGSGELISLDAHPLLREYFGRQLHNEQPDAWRAAHRRLYEHLTETTKEGDQPALEDLQPLYQAVAHGCQAGLQQEALEKIYHDRILRGTGIDGFYSSRKLGAFGSDLGVVASFFDTRWSRISAAVAETWQAWLLNVTGYTLRALGRLTEALEPLRAALEMAVTQENWKAAAIRAGNLSELNLTLGKVASAVADAEAGVKYADKSREDAERRDNLTTYANALRQWGRGAEAAARFREAEEMQAQSQPLYPLLYSQRGFQYCDLLLAEAERAAWHTNLKLETRNSELETAAASCRAVSERATKMFEWRVPNDPLLDMALDHLTLGRAALYAFILHVASSGNRQSAIENLTAAVEGLRRAGTTHHIPSALLSRAWLRFLESDSEGARDDLDQASEIAERGPMLLFMADIHLYRARLFHAVKPYPWNKNPDGTERGPKDDLAAAKKLIKDCGYGRRKEELEDAEAAANNW